MSTEGILAILGVSEVELGWENIPHRLYCGYPVESKRFLHVVDWRHVPERDIMDVSEKSSVYGLGSSTDEAAEEQ